MNSLDRTCHKFLRVPAAPGVRALPLVCVLVLAANASTAQSWIETRASIEQLVEDGDTVAAAALGPALISQGSAEFGEFSEQLTESYLLVAGLQMTIAEYGAAENSVLAAIDIHLQTDGPLSPGLIEPYVALGDALLGGNAAELALGAYNEARAISRRAYGLRNPAQIPILYRMADSTEAMADVDGALDLLFDAIDLIEQNYGSNSGELLEAIYRFAAWLSMREYYSAAGSQYRIAASAFVLPPLETVRVLRLAAENFRLAAREYDDRNGPRRPIELMSALGIVEGLGEEFALLRAEILRDIADWQIVFGNKFEIEGAYARAWLAVSRLENSEEIRREWFSRTVPLYLGSFRTRVLSTDDDALDGRVELRFTVNTNGTADDIEVIAADPPGLVDSAARRRVNLSRFRPGFENGELVATTRDISFDFRYDPRFADESESDTRD